MIGIIKAFGEIFTRFKIPTLLGIAIITLGTGAGVFLVMQEQLLITQAGPDQTPNQVTVVNLQDTGAAITWQTNSPTRGYVKFGQNTADQTSLDDRDTTETKERTEHFVTLKNLIPKTTYQFEVFSNNSTDEKVYNFTTASDNQNTQASSLQPIIGSVIAGTQPLQNGLAYLTIPGAALQATPVTELGTFTIPLVNVYSEDFTNLAALSEDTTAKIKVVSGTVQATAAFKLSYAGQPLPPLKMGEDLDLTMPSATSTLLPSAIYDLNNDGSVNTTDYSLAVKNKGKTIKSIRSDLENLLIDDKYLQDLRDWLSNNPTP